MRGQCGLSPDLVEGVDAELFQLVLEEALPVHLQTRHLDPVLELIPVHIRAHLVLVGDVRLLERLYVELPLQPTCLERHSLLLVLHDHTRLGSCYRDHGAAASHTAGAAGASPRQNRSSLLLTDAREHVLRQLRQHPLGLGLAVILARGQ